ncbi:hypothetical protein MW887_008136 [Aspergillus wentii]|nr:hypothetical protein MW887_008136 [Aspergillus wentii]
MTHGQTPAAKKTRPALSQPAIIPNFTITSIFISISLKIPVPAIMEKYGLQLVEKIYFLPISGPNSTKLTEETKEKNRLQAREKYSLKEYNKLQQELRCLLDDNIFISESINFLASKITGIPGDGLRPEFEDAEIIRGLSFEEKTKIVKIRLWDARLSYSMNVNTLRMLSKAFISQELGQPREPEPDTPEILYRLFTSGDHTRHSKDLGFRCSNQSLTSPVYRNGTLVDSNLVDEAALRNQCKGGNPSDLIALSDSPSRIFNLIKGWSLSAKEGDKIAVISVSKLLAMGVLINRTTTLAESLNMPLRRGNQPDGLEYANLNYWVAHRWIPAECIESYISISLLQKACASRGINKGDYCTRLSLGDLDIDLLSSQFEAMAVNS